MRCVEKLCVFLTRLSIFHYRPDYLLCSSSYPSRGPIVIAKGHFSSFFRKVFGNKAESWKVTMTSMEIYRGQRQR